MRLEATDAERVQELLTANAALRQENFNLKDRLDVLNDAIISWTSVKTWGSNNTNAEPVHTSYWPIGIVA